MIGFPFRNVVWCHCWMEWEWKMHALGPGELRKWSKINGRLEKRWPPEYRPAKPKGSNWLLEKKAATAFWLSRTEHYSPWKKYFRSKQWKPAKKRQWKRRTKKIKSRVPWRLLRVFGRSGSRDCDLLTSQDDLGQVAPLCSVIFMLVTL